MGSEWILLPIWAFIVCLGVMCCLTICCSCFTLCCFGCFARKKDRQTWDKNSDEENQTLSQLVMGDQPMEYFKRGNSRNSRGPNSGGTIGKEGGAQMNEANVDGANQMNGNEEEANGNESNESVEVTVTNGSSIEATDSRNDAIYPRLLPLAPAAIECPAENPPPIPAGQMGENANAIDV